MTTDPFKNLTPEQRQQLIQQLQTTIPTNNILDYSTTNQLIPPNNGASTYNVPNSYPPAPSLSNNFNMQLPIEQIASNGLNQYNQAYLTGQGTPNTEIQQAMIESGYPETVESETVVTSSPTNFQFYNPYGGYDLPTSAFKLGQFVNDGNTLGTVASGLKVGTGLARNFLGGLSYNRRNQEVMEDYRAKQRNAFTQSNNVQQYEDGGEMMQQPQNEEEQLLQEVGSALQNGEDPQVVLQTLLDMGVNEQTAQSMIEFVLQQLEGAPQATATEDTPVMEDGGQYLEVLRGKKIKDYKYNSETGNYDVTYE